MPDVTPIVLQQIDLDIVPGKTPPIVHVSEYDTGRNIVVNLFRDGYPFGSNSIEGYTVKVEGSIGKYGFSENADWADDAEGVVVINLTEAMTAIHGRVWTKIKLIKSESMQISTCGFWMDVDRAGVEADTVIGAPGFEEQIQTAVDNYLEEHPAGVEVDPTLSIEGAAADAKATGKIKAKLVLNESHNLSGADSDWTDGYYVDNGNGNIIAVSGLSYSILIPVNEGDVIRLYATSKTTGSFEQSQMRAVATYDADGNDVKNPDATGWKVDSYTVASGIKFVRVSAITSLTNYMVTKNFVPTAYEPYYEPYYFATKDFIANAFADLIADQPFFTLPKGGQSRQALLSDGADGAVWGEAQGGGNYGAITEKLTLKHSHNLSCADSDWTDGYYADNGNGNLIASSTLSASDFIPVNEGDVIRLFDLYGNLFANREMRAVATYDANKTAVRNPDATGWKVRSYTVVSGIKYVRVSAPTATQYMITKNYEPTVFEPWFEPFYVATDDFVVDAIGDVKTTDLKNEVAFALPQTTFRQTVGIAETWYKHSMVTPPNLLISVNASYANTANGTEGFTFANASTVDSPNGFVWFAHDPYMNLLKYFDNNTGYGAARKVIAENLANCTLLAIGDSTVDSDDMTGSLLDYFTSKGKTLTLLGTLGKSGSATNKNEGRAGWTTEDYVTNSMKNGYTNPFYNSETGTFDFSYYMTQQGYSGVDFVVIQLGINDLYPKTARLDPEPDYAAIWSNVATMIDSIRAYNSNIKILINLPTTPNSDPSLHSIAEYLYNHYVVKYNEYALAQIKTYASGVRASYCHLILDPATDIRDNVHPTAAGYEKMALELINQINVWQNGA